MSYQVLARKWRPGKFAELVGQEHVVSAISNALDNDRLHRAYLFTGTRGVGKTTIARIFSKSLNCEEGQSANPCGQCATCKEIEQGNYVDLLEIDAASRTKVEDTRELLDNVQYRPTRGRYKVYLIDEVHMLSKHSFNALLKTLEEPPPHVKFLLATTDPQKLPVTILSRCLQFNLKALSREQITQQLAHILDAESIHYEAPALTLLAKAAQGSMRDALSLTDQAIAQGDNQVSQAVVTDMLGLMDKNQLLRVIHALITKTPQDVLNIVDEMAQQAPDYGQVLSELSSLLHQIALTQWVPDACKLETTSARAIFQLAKSVSAEQVQLFYQIALNGKRDLPLAPDGRSALEMTLLRMMSFAPATPVDDTESVISEMPVSTPAAAATQTSAPVASSVNAEPQAGSEAKPNTEGERPPLQSESPAQATETEAARPSPTSRPADETSAADTPIPESENDAPPVEEDYPPLSAYEDDYAPPEETLHGEQPMAPGQADISQASDEDDNSHLSSTEAMLALRQQFKKPRQGGDESPVKKPETPETAGQPTFPPTSTPQNGDVELAAAQSMPAPSPATPASDDERDATHSPMASADNTAGVHDSGMTDVASVADTPPWQTDPETSLTDDAAPPQARPPASVADVEQGHETAPGETLAQSPATIPAFLENGDKVVHASQLDAWSHLVEQMPIAGLLKQLALHSAFSRHDDHVALELDHNQAHLLNQSSEQQLCEALKQALGEHITLSVTVGEPAITPFALQQQVLDMRQGHAHSVVANDDVIQSLLSTFEADVMSDSVKPR